MLCFRILAVFCIAGAAIAQSSFRVLSEAELARLDLRQSAELLSVAARTGENVVVMMDEASQGAVVQDGVSVLFDCSPLLARFPGRTIQWFRYIYFDLDHTVLSPPDPQLPENLNFPNSLRRIEGESDQFYRILRTRIQMGAEDPHRGVYECLVCDDGACDSANVTLPLVGRPPLLNSTTGGFPDNTFRNIELYRIGARIGVDIHPTDFEQNRPLARVELRCPNIEFNPGQNIPPDVPTPVRTWTHTSLDGSVSAVMSSDQVRNAPEFTDEFRAAFPLLTPVNTRNIFVVVTSGDQDSLFFEIFNITKDDGARYQILKQAFGFWTCQLNNSIGSAEATTLITDEDIDPLETLLIPQVSGSTVTVYVDSPLADYVRIILSGDSGHRGVYRMNGSSGTVEFTDVPPGSYHIRAVASSRVTAAAVVSN